MTDDKKTPEAPDEKTVETPKAKAPAKPKAAPKEKAPEVPAPIVPGDYVIEVDAPEGATSQRVTIAGIDADGSEWIAFDLFGSTTRLRASRYVVVTKRAEHEAEG